MQFENTSLNPDILKGLKKIGFSTMTPIQEQVIEVMLNSQEDLIGIAQTGTGKTAAFGLPVINACDPEANHVQALVLTPTRELCLQVASDLSEFAKYVDHIDIVAVYGGAGIDKQIAALRKKPRIIVGTPGRTRDLIQRRKLDVKKIKTLILDEADEMLSMGFKEELDDILSKTPAEKQTLLFSATMPREIKKMIDKQMTDPIEITVGKRNIGSDNVEHSYYMANASDRYNALKRIVDFNPDIYAIVFCRTRLETKEVSDKLMSDGYNVDALHGDLSQAQRDSVMKRFRERHLQILVATDVAARGLDVRDLTHIINYKLPDELEAYIHRSGRTGRAGKHGACLTIIHSREQSKLREIEKRIQKPFEKKLIPTGEEVRAKQLFKLVDRMIAVEVDDSQIEPFMTAIHEKLASLTREDLIKRFVSIEFNQFLDYYKGAPDLNRVVKGKEKKTRHRQQVNFTRVFINIGSRDGIAPANLIGLINECVGRRDTEIGKIEIMKSFSFLEIDSNFTDELQKGGKSIEMDGRELVIEIAQKRQIKPTKTKSKSAKRERTKRKRANS